MAAEMWNQKELRKPDQCVGLGAEAQRDPVAAPTEPAVAVALFSRLLAHCSTFSFVHVECRCVLRWALLPPEALV